MNRRHMGNHLLLDANTEQGVRGDELAVLAGWEDEGDALLLLNQRLMSSAITLVTEEECPRLQSCIVRRKKKDSGTSVGQLYPYSLFI